MSKIVYLTKFGTFSENDQFAVKEYQVPEHIETLLLLSEQDFENDVFVGKNYYANKYKSDIFMLKQELEKYKEDVEQVELFGMERADYEQKKKRCAEIIIELRTLENEMLSLRSDYEN